MAPISRCPPWCDGRMGWRVRQSWTGVIFLQPGPSAGYMASVSLSFLTYKVKIMPTVYYWGNACSLLLWWGSIQITFAEPLSRASMCFFRHLCTSLVFLVVICVSSLVFSFSPFEVECSPPAACQCRFCQQSFSEFLLIFPWQTTLRWSSSLILFLNPVCPLDLWEVLGDAISGLQLSLELRTALQKE